MKLRILFILILFTNTIQLSAQDYWSFVSAPDWHTGDRELRHPAKPYSQEDVDLQLKTINDMKSCSPELFLIAGDLCGGPWVGDAWVSIYGMEGTQADAIINVADIIYTNLKQRFSEYGLDNVLVAIGDHEIGEDSNWKPGSEVSHLLPVYRDGFQRIWNRDKQGNFIYSAKIGDANSRPLGTPWENTSYAYKYRNVLFLTVDIFNQPDPDIQVGIRENSIYANMPESHLAWFENVLKEARKDHLIKHIIVQAHTPVLAPVRGRRSSMLYMEYGEHSSFWQMMKKYKVDLYFAGEVHTPSAQREKDSFPIQVVHGDYAGSNYIQVEVYNDKLILNLRETDGVRFSSVGEIIIDKSQGETYIEDTGVLKLFNPEEALVHYTFDEKSRDEIPNIAQMAKYYNLKTNEKLTDGISGNALELNGSEINETAGYGVMTFDHPSTFITWIKTRQEGDSYIASHGGGLQFDVVLKNGNLTVYTSPKSCLLSKGPKLNDGEWHQLAVVVPEIGSNLSNVQILIDGKPVETFVDGDDQQIRIIPAYRMRVGGPNISPNKILSDLGFQNFIGAMDEFTIWSRALSFSEIKREYKRIKN